MFALAELIDNALHAVLGERASAISWRLLGFGPAIQVAFFDSPGQDDQAMLVLQDNGVSPGPFNCTQAGRHSLPGLVSRYRINTWLKCRSVLRF